MTYDPHAYPPFAVTVDLAVFTIRDGQLSVLLIERDEEPFEGAWALPGGFVRPEEDLHEAASRELAEETGLERFAGHLEQLRSYGNPDRDPRMRVVSVAYVAFVPDLPEPGAAGTRRRDGGGEAMTCISRLACDPRRGLQGHRRAAARLRPHRDPGRRGRPGRRQTGVHLPGHRVLPAEFTLGELQQVYEAVWGVPLVDRANFRRKVLQAPGFVRPVDGDPHRLTGGRGRPAQLYRGNDAAELNPPIKRPRGARSVRQHGPMRQKGPPVPDTSAPVTLWRPTGQNELDLVKESGWQAWPPRLPEQPIFYPVLNRWYATKITRDWNVAHRGVGFVTQFEVDRSFLDSYEVHQAGGREVLEYWIPAEDLDSFNVHIVGSIKGCCGVPGSRTRRRLRQPSSYSDISCRWPGGSILQSASWLRQGWLDSGAFVTLYSPAETVAATQAWGEARPGILGSRSSPATEQASRTALDLRSDPAPVMLVNMVSAGWVDAIPQYDDVRAFVDAIENGSFTFRFEP